MTVIHPAARAATREKLLKPVDVSDWTGLSVQVLAQLRFTGAGPKFLKPTARTVLYRESDVQAWLDASERQSTAKAVSA